MKLVEYNETYYENRYKVFGGIWKSGGDFFIEQVEDCTANPLHEVIRRHTMENSVVSTDGHASYRSLREKMPEIAVEHHVVIHLKKNYNCRYGMTTNNIEGVWISSNRLLLARVQKLIW